MGVVLEEIDPLQEWIVPHGRRRDLPTVVLLVQHLEWWAYNNKVDLCANEAEQWPLAGVWDS
jgi:hypothetical protein